MDRKVCPTATTSRTVNRWPLTFTNVFKPFGKANVAKLKPFGKAWVGI